MNQNIDQRDDPITTINKRLFDRKDAILRASQDMEDLRSEYKAKGCKDPDGRIEAEVFKRIYTITSCLSELIAYAENPSPFRILINSLPDLLIPARAIGSKPGEKETENGALHIVEFKSITFICLWANSIEIHARGKKEPFVKIGELGSLINLIKMG